MKTFKMLCFYLQMNKPGILKNSKEIQPATPIQVWLKGWMIKITKKSKHTHGKS